MKQTMQPVHAIKQSIYLDVNAIAYPSVICFELCSEFAKKSFYRIGQQRLAVV
jgi:hypothetical protein